MQLTSAQKTTLKASIAANVTTLNTIDVQSGNTVLHNQTVAIQNVADIGDNFQRIAEWYNLPTAAYLVWKTNADRATLDAQVNKANFTPSDAVPSSPSTDMTYQNRALLCQLKQTNAQWLTGGTGTVDARVTSLRQNFKDCLTGIPAGASGANVDAGWGTAGTPGAVRLVMMRLCTNLEKLFVTAISSSPGNDGVPGNRGTNTNPDLLVLEGSNLTGPDVSDAILNG